MNILRLWAPWRLQYIQSFDRDSTKKSKGCFICRAARSEDHDDGLVVVKTRLSIALLNRYPYNNGHLLTAPRAHKGGLHGLSERELLDLFKLTRDMIATLNKSHRPQGFNVGINLGDAAGTSLPSHIHVHIVPRWNGDTNFMPMIADTKVMPELLGKTLQTLKNNLVVNGRAKKADIKSKGSRG